MSEVFLSLRSPELSSTQACAAKVIYRIPKLDEFGRFLRPKADKKSGFFHKGSHGKKAREWHP